MLYQKAIDSKVRVVEWTAQEDLVKYYNASDIYLFPKFYEKESEAETEKFMGFGVAPVEALACQVPVVGTNMKVFPGTQEEKMLVGETPRDKADLVKCIERVFENPEDYKGCREVAEKYYSWSTRVGRILETFDELEQKYYGGKRVSL